jgi:hypothetical protein
MIARIWHGVTAAAKSDEYLGYLNETGVPDYRATEGNRGVYVLRRIEGERAHFLLDFEPTVSHYEVLSGPRQLPERDA